VARLNVTRLFSCGGISDDVQIVVGELLKMSSSFLSALICCNPFMLFFPFNACIRSLVL
jgi:hypothetical protein